MVLSKAKSLFMEYYISRVKVDSSLNTAQQKKEAAAQLKKQWEDASSSALNSWKKKARKVLEDEMVFDDDNETVPTKILGKRAHP